MAEQLLTFKNPIFRKATFYDFSKFELIPRGNRSYIQSFPFFLFLVVSPSRLFLVKIPRHLANICPIPKGFPFPFRAPFPTKTSPAHSLTAGS